MVKIILSDKDLKVAIYQGKIKVTPFDESLIDSSSLGLKLGSQIRIFKNISQDYLDPFEEQEHHTELIELKGEKFLLKPGEFVLVSSKEYISLPNDMAARLMPRQSLSRLGVLFLGCASLVEPGFEGNLTFTIGNVSQTPIALYPDMHCCKLVFETLTSEAEVPYHKQKRAKYQKQKGPVTSRLHMEKNLKYFR